MAHQEHPLCITMDLVRRLSCFASPKAKATKKDIARKLKASSTPYRPLDGKKQEIRLLLIEPAIRVDDPVHCRLKTRSLKDNPEYNALSYVWGNPISTRSIFINSVEIGVAENLFSALQHLRRSDEVVTLWVDAICINQSDDIERNSQVRQMYRIFASANTVHAWLGRESSKSRDVFEMIHDLTSGLDDGSENPLDTMTIVDSTQPHWDKWNAELRAKLDEDSSFSASCTSDLRMISLPWIINHPYWTRVWIQQELLLARRVILQSGDVKMSLRRYVRFNMLLGIIVEKHKSSAFTRPPIPAYYNPIAAYIQDLQFDYLPYLVNRFRTLDCSDERDHVYGLLGLYNGPNTPIDVRYDHPVETVYSDFFLWIATHYQELPIDGSNGIATGSGFNPRREQLPSWAPDLTNSVSEESSPLSAQYLGADGGYQSCFNLDRKSMALESQAFIVDRIQAFSSFGSAPTQLKETNLTHFLVEKVKRNRREEGNYFRDVFLSIREVIVLGTVPDISGLEALGFCAWIFLRLEKQPESEHHSHYVEFRERYDIDEERVAPKIVPILRFIQLTGYVGAARDFCDTYGRDEGLARLVKPTNLGSYWADFLDIPIQRESLRRFDLLNARGAWLLELMGDVTDWVLFITESGHIGKSPAGLMQGDEICILPGC